MQLMFICHVCLQLTDRRISLDDGKPRPTKDAAFQHKVNTTAKCLKHTDMLKAPESRLRRPPVDVCQPPHLSSQTLPRNMLPQPLPVPQHRAKTLSRRSAPGREGGMPPNLLNELHLVLNKTGRTAKSSD